MRWAILMTAAVSSPSFASQNQFDLVCTGEKQVYVRPAMRAEPFKATYHIDLGKAEYCVDECVDVKKIQQTSSLRITLIDISHGKGTLAPVQDSRILDRRTGELKIDYLNGGTLERLLVTATCKPQTFTPFPQTKF